MASLSLTLDHVGLLTPDLDRLAAAYARLGFRLTPRSQHKGRLAPDGPVEPWGTGNHCAMFPEGYLELLGITDWDRHVAHVKGRLDRYAGLHLIALGCSDVDQVHARLGGAVDGMAAPSELYRDVPYGDGTRPGGFRLVYLAERTFPEAMLFYIQHLTPEVLWQPALLDHPNGTVGLGPVTICTDAPRATADRLSRLLDCRPATAEGGYAFPLAAGSIEIVDPATLASRYPGVAPPTTPWVAAAAFRVSDLADAHRFLSGMGVAVREAPRGLWVAPDEAEGAVVEFVPASVQLPRVL